MAASINGVLEQTLQKSINSCKLLVVGAGGIGCELIKNLVLTGFHDVELVNRYVRVTNSFQSRFVFPHTLESGPLPDLTSCLWLSC